MTDRRLILVHAHPDDETIGSGVTMAKYAAQGAAVTLVTCTRGEEGEVLVPELAHLASAADDELGPHREIELSNAMAVLGISDHRFLGGAGRYRDSGMMGTPQNDRADCFWRADLTEAATELVSIIRETRPQVLLTYDTNGAYGHPDHIQAHRVAMYGAQLAAAPSYRPDLGAPWEIAKIYWTGIPKSSVQKGIDALVKSGGSGFFGIENVDDIPWAVDDAVVTTEIDGLEFEPAKIQALKEHTTQVELDGPFFRMSAEVGPEAMGYEHFVLVKGTKGTSTLDALGRETDLFDGLA